MLLWFAVALANEPVAVTVAFSVRTMGVNGAGELFSEVSDVVHDTYDLDLDLDGRLDRAVPVFDESASPWTLRYALWLRRGEGWVAAGEVVGAPRIEDGVLRTQTVEVRATGPKDRPPVGHGAHPPERRQTVRTYQLQDDRVSLIEEQVSSGTCHHCGITTSGGARRIP